MGKYKYGVFLCVLLLCMVYIDCLFFSATTRRTRFVCIILSVFCRCFVLYSYVSVFSVLFGMLIVWFVLCVMCVCFVSVLNVVLVIVVL